MPINTNTLFEGAPANLAPAQYQQMNAQTNLANIQGQQAQMNMAQALKAQQEDEAIKAMAQRRLTPDGKLDIPGLVQDVTRVNPMKGQALGQHFAQQELAQTKARAEAQDALAKMDATDKANIYGLLSDVATTARTIREIPDPQERYNAYATALQQKAQEYAPKETDSTTLKAAKINMQQGLQQEYQSLGQLTGPDDLNARLDQHFNAAKKEADWIKEDQAKAERAAKADEENWAPHDVLGNVALINKKTGEVKLTGLKPDQGKGGGSGSAGPLPAYDTLSDSDRRIVDQLASRQLLVGRAGGFQLNNPRNQGLYSLAVQKNPSLSVVDNAAYQKFVTDLASSSPNSAGGRVDSANRMLGHAADLVDALDKLNPGSGITGKIGNFIAYPGEKAFGSTMAPVSFIKAKLMAEVNKLVTGGVPHAEELKRDIEDTPLTSTKEQWGSLIKAVADVGLEQVYAAEEKRRNLLGQADPGTSLLSERAQKALGRISKYAGVAPPNLNSASGQGYTTTGVQGSGANHPAASQMQEGTVSASGKYVWKGGAWVAR